MLGKEGVSGNVTCLFSLIKLNVRLSHHLPEGRNVQGAESLLPHWGFLGLCKWRLSSVFIMAAVDAPGPRPCWKVGALADGLLSLLVRLASEPFLQLTRPKILVVFV